MNVFSHTKPITDENGTLKKGSIALLEKILIGGTLQHVLIRGESLQNPVLLMVHGGPGQSDMYMSHKLYKDLEKYFTIIHWDQRGAAKSYSKNLDPETMNLSKLLSDGEELILYLKKKLGHEKFYLHGHSFGTILGMLMVHQYPQHFHAYIGVAQATGLLRNLEVSYDFVMQKAQQTRNEKALQDLESIGRPPFHSFSKGLWKYSLWLEKFGGKTYSKPGRQIFKYIFSAPEYSLVDKINFFKGSLFSVKHLHQELLVTDLESLIDSVEIPIYFFLGRHDYSVPAELAEQFFNKLNAPEKKIIWFEQSGHLPQYEETERYTQELIRVLN